VTRRTADQRASLKSSMNRGGDHRRLVRTVPLSIRCNARVC